jgi:hypothetical protein
MVPARQLTSQAQTLRAMELTLHFPVILQRRAMSLAFGVLPTLQLLVL